MSENEKTNLSNDELLDVTASDLEGTGGDARLPSSEEPSKTTKKKKPKKRSSETEPTGEATGEGMASKKKEKKKTSSKKKKKPKAPTPELEPSQESDIQGEGLSKKKKKKKKASQNETHEEADKTIPKKKKKPKAQAPPDSAVENEGELLSEKNKNKKETKSKKEKKTRTKSPRPSREITPVLDREIEVPIATKKMSQIDECSINSQECNSMEYSAEDYSINSCEEYISLEPNGDTKKHRFSNHTGPKRNRRGDGPVRKGKRPPSDVELRGKRPSSATEKTFTMSGSFSYYDEEEQRWRYSNSTLGSNNGGQRYDERGRHNRQAQSRTPHRKRYPEEDEYVDVDDDEDEMYMREMGYDDQTDGSLYDGYFYDHHGLDDERPSFKKVTLDLADTGIRDTKCCLISAGVIFILMTIGVSVMLAKLMKRDEWGQE